MSVGTDLVLFTVAFKIEGKPVGDFPNAIGRMPLKFTVGGRDASWSVTILPFDAVIAPMAWHLGLAQVLKEATPGWRLGQALDLQSGGQWVGSVGECVGCC